MRHYFLLFTKLFLILLALVFCNLIFAQNIKKYSTVEEFISDQQIIRITTDHQPGLGNQAASANVMSRLRKMGFKGTFEFVYPDNVTNKIITLFDLPQDISANYYDEKRKIRFIRLSEWVTYLRNNSIEFSTLGITGAFRKDPADPIDDNDIDTTGLTHFQLHNFANFMNVKIFVDLNNYPSFSTDNYFNFFNKDTSDHINNNNTYFTMPVADLAEAKDYLNNDKRGQDLLRKIPALKTFIEGMEKQSFNVMPAYGFTLLKTVDGKDIEDFPGNILQVIAGARYSQLKGRGEFFKPLIIPVFYNYDKEGALLMSLLSSDNWGAFEKPGAEQARKVIKELSLSDPKVFSFINISDANANKRIEELQAGQILLISMGPLPKIVFDGLYTHTSSNIWPQIREGASSFDSLVLTGRPHFRCRDDIWEIGFELVKDQNLKSQLEKFYGNFCRGMNTWNNQSSAYQTLGDLIIESQDKNSLFSRYFQDLKNEAQKPEHDRIFLSLEFAMQQIF